MRSRIDQLSAYGVQISSEWINYALIDDITDQFEPIISLLQKETFAIEEEILLMDGVGVQSDMLRRIGMVRRRVMQVHRLISPKADVINTILKRYVDADAETKYYLEDIHDHGKLDLIKF